MPKSRQKTRQVVRVEFAIRRELLEELEWIARENYASRSEAITTALLGYYRPIQDRFHKLVVEDIDRGLDPLSALRAEQLPCEEVP